MGGQSFLAFGLEIANFGLTIAGIYLSSDRSRTALGHIGVASAEGLGERAIVSRRLI